MYPMLVESFLLWYDGSYIRRAGVAQSVEQRFCKPQVGGSIPLASSIQPMTAKIRQECKSTGIRGKVTTCSIKDSAVPSNPSNVLNSARLFKNILIRPEPSLTF
jgi:hypothetical protein